MNAQNYAEAMTVSFQYLTWLSIGLCFLAFIVAMFFIDPSIEKASSEDNHDQEAEEKAQRTGIRRIFGASLDDGPFDRR